MPSVNDEVPQTKGSQVVKSVKTLRHFKEEARKLLPPPLQTYLEQRILPTSWYPLADQFELTRGIVEIYVRKGLSPTTAEAWKLMGRVAAEDDAEHLYKMMVTKGKPVATLQGYAALWPLHYNRGRLEVQESGGGGGAQVATFDFPFPFAEWCLLNCHYKARLAELSGAENVVAEEAKCVSRGDAYCLTQLRWDRR